MNNYLITGKPRIILYNILIVLAFMLGAYVSVITTHVRPNIDLSYYPAVIPPQDEELLYARIDEALLSMKEGSDRSKLYQIADYLSNRIGYDIDQEDLLTALSEGRGECEMYSGLFYRMANRLGIKTYICIGYADGWLHAWNAVELDGRTYYYDVTWFDSKQDYKYLHSPDSWGREIQSMT